MSSHTRKYPFWPYLAALVVVWGVAPLLASEVVVLHDELYGCSSLECRDVLGRAGSFGDIFGWVNALLSGLALVGLVWNQHVQGEERRREAKPFLVPALAATSADTLSDAFTSLTIAGRRVKSAKALLDIKLDLIISNQCAQDIALNASYKLFLQEPSLQVSGSFQMPFVGSTAQKASNTISVIGNDLETLESILGSDKPLIAELECSYQNVAGAKWVSKVTLEVFLNPDTTDRERPLLKEAVHTTGETSLWTKETTIALRYKVREGSWKHTEN